MSTRIRRLLPGQLAGHPETLLHSASCMSRIRTASVNSSLQIQVHKIAEWRQCYIHCTCIPIQTVTSLYILENKDGGSHKPPKKPKSKSHYDRRPVSQYGLVSSPIWDFWPESFFFSFLKLRSCLCGAPSLTRGRVCLLSVLVNTVYSCQSVIS
jgi:hypothetical protein